MCMNNTCNHTLTDFEPLYRKPCMHSFIQRQTDQILSPRLFATQQKVEGGVQSCDTLQQMAHLLLPILFLASSRSSATCGGGHALRKRPPSPKSRMQVIYLEGSRSPQIKVCRASAWLFLSRFCTSLSDWMSLKVTVTLMGVCLCQWIISRIHFKYICWSQKYTRLMVCFMWKWYLAWYSFSIETLCNIFHVYALWEIWLSLSKIKFLLSKSRSVINS